VDISSRLRLTPSIRGSSQPFTPAEFHAGALGSRPASRAKAAH
jgi:hypothetical protein